MAGIKIAFTRELSLHSSVRSVMKSGSFLSTVWHLDAYDRLTRFPHRGTSSAHLIMDPNTYMLLCGYCLCNVVCLLSAEQSANGEVERLFWEVG